MFGVAIAAGFLNLLSLAVPLTPLVPNWSAERQHSEDRRCSRAQQTRKMPGEIMCVRVG